jgi:hypothetical protein
MSVAIQLQSGEYLKLYEKISIKFFLKSALFNEKIESTSRSYSFKAPAEPNAQNFNFANELAVRQRVLTYPVKIYLLGNFWKNAQLEITDFNEKEFTFRLLIDRGFFKFDAGKSLRSFNYENPYRLRFYKNALPYSYYGMVDTGVLTPATFTITFNLTYSSTPIVKVFDYDPGTKTVPQLVAEICAWFNERIEQYHYYFEVSTFSNQEFTIYNLSNNTNSNFYFTFTSSDVNLDINDISNVNKTQLDCYRALVNEAIADDEREFICITVAAPEIYTVENTNYYDYLNPIIPKITGNPLYPGQLAQDDQPLVPFPLVKKMLYMILQETGNTISEDTFFDDELSQLILFNHEAINNFQRLVKNGWRYSLTGVIYYNDIVPDISFNTFLNDIRQYFNLLVDYNSRNLNVKILRIDSLFDQLPENWSKHLLKEWNYRQEPIEAGLDYTWVEEPLSDELLPQFENTARGTDVNFKSNLPVSPVNGLVIVKATKENKFYRYETSAWQLFAEDLYNSQTERNRRIVTGCSPLFTIQYPYTKPNVLWPFQINWLLPYTKQPGNLLKEDKVAAPHRYLIYRGWQDCLVKLTSESEFVTAEYPFASSHNYDLAGNKIGDYSLAWNAEDGVYEKFWKRWLNFLKNSSPVMMEFDLSIIELMEMDLTRKKLINGVEYFIDELEFEVNQTISTARAKMYPIYKTHE